MNNTHEILQQYCDQKIGWREACAELMLWDIEELDSLIEEANIRPHFVARLEKHHD